MKIIIILLGLILLTTQGALKECVNNAFTNTCKTQLYQCFNTSDCSYQLHTNTQHIYINDDDKVIPKMYFSNPLAVSLH